MPVVVNDMGVMKRYGLLVLDGVALPALGCVCGALYHLGGGIVYAFSQFLSTTWVSARADWAIAYNAFKASAAK